MIRLTWLQFRMQAVVTIGLLIILAIGLAITGHQIAHLYDTTVVNCSAKGDCPDAGEAVLKSYTLLQDILGLLMLAAPAVVGIFLGAPLVARELEAGTFRLAWTQSVSRRRWLAVKLGAIGLASIAIGGLLSLMVTWWFSPIDKLNLNRFNPGIFDERGIVALGYAAFAFALGVTAGVLFRRTLPAMAVNLIAFVGVRLAMTSWVRPHLMTPAHTSVPLTSATNLGLVHSPTGITFQASAPPISNAWNLSSQIVDGAGHPATQAVLHQSLQQMCPSIATSSAPASVAKALGAPGPANQTAFQNCVTKMSTEFHVVATYQPASRYWTFQSYEMLIYIGLTLVLAGFCYWWVRYRIA